MNAKSLNLLYFLHLATFWRRGLYLHSIQGRILRDTFWDSAENADINFKLVTGVTYDISKKKKKKK